MAGRAGHEEVDNVLGFGRVVVASRGPEKFIADEKGRQGCLAQADTTVLKKLSTGCLVEQFLVEVHCRVTNSSKLSITREAANQAASWGERELSPSAVAKSSTIRAK